MAVLAAEMRKGRGAVDPPLEVAMEEFLRTVEAFEKDGVRWFLTLLFHYFSLNFFTVCICTAMALIFPIMSFSCFSYSMFLKDRDRCYHRWT